MALSEAEILRVLELFDRSGWNEMQLESGSVKLRIVKTGPLQHAAAGSRSAPLAAPAAAAAAAPVASAAPPAAPVAAADPRWVAVKAPMLGHFYAAPKPGAPPFVTVGKAVAADETVAILEVMKLMNHVKAGVAGRIARIDVHNGDLVEFDQAMLYIDPS